MRHTPGWFRLILFVLVLICGLPGWTAAAKRFDEARQVTGLMQEQLALLGYAAEVASDGVQALQMWRNGHYDLLLTDCHMPLMDGFELMETIRRTEPPGTHRPIVAVTANAMQGEAERCIARGFDAYLAKPLRLTELAVLLARWLPLEHARPGDKVQPSQPGQPEQTAATAPIWDTTTLTRLMGPKPAVQRRVLSKFLINTQERIAAVERARAAGRIEDIAFEAHSLKSAAATVGAMALSQLCQELELACRAGSQEGCDRLVQPLREAFDAAAELIRPATI